MMEGKVTVAIPVGPHASDQRWFADCLASVRVQTRPPDEVLIIDDMAGVPPVPLHEHPYPIRTWHTPWLLGVAHAMNFGVALARSDLVFMLCADDTLHPDCLRRCLDAYLAEPKSSRDLGYYFVGVRYLDGREEDEQFIACGAAMVTKELWRTCGGFPPESASGAPDAALISTMLVHSDAGHTVGVSRGTSLYNCRPHADSDTAKRQAWQGVILSSRDQLTRQWTKPQWGRMS